MSKKVNLIILADIKEYIGMLDRGEISSSRFADILNDLANERMTKKEKSIVFDERDIGVLILLFFILITIIVS